MNQIKTSIPLGKKIPDSTSLSYARTYGGIGCSKKPGVQQQKEILDALFLLFALIMKQGSNSITKLKNIVYREVIKYLIENQIIAKTALGLWDPILFHYISDSEPRSYVG